MSRKRRTYTADFKAKVVLELIEGQVSLNEIASKYELLPKNIQNWKKQFMENISLAFDKTEIVKEYKEQIIALKKDKDATSKKLGETIVERDFVVEKLQCLVSYSAKKDLVEIEHKISQTRQLKLLSISKTAYYHKTVEKFSSKNDIKLLQTIDTIHNRYPYYGTRRVSKLLDRAGIKAGRKLVKTSFEYMRIKALYPKTRTTIANKEHKKYPYLLSQYKNDKNQVVIDIPNKVWSTDITYIKLSKGTVYLASIIDWYSKKILSWKLSNTMDVLLTTSVLEHALKQHKKPEILNTDQGSQYTALKHTEILKKNNIDISMDAKGRSIDNIAIERFWRTIKYEDIYPNSYLDIKEARNGIKEYINIYNKERLHSTLNYLTPNEVFYRGLRKQCYNAKSLLRKVA